MDIEVIGATGEIGSPAEFISSLARAEGEVLAVNADMVCGRDHLLSAALHAWRAFRRGSNSADTLAMETLLYAAGERQISRAMDKMGVPAGASRLGLVLFNVPDPEGLIASLALQRRDEVLDASEEKLIRLGTSKEELGILPEQIRGDLALEMVAFVDLLKR